jgi:hypothetical protein
MRNEIEFIPIKSSSIDDRYSFTVLSSGKSEDKIRRIVERFATDIDFRSINNTLNIFGGQTETKKK